MATAKRRRSGTTAEDVDAVGHPRLPVQSSPSRLLSGSLPQERDTGEAGLDGHRINGPPRLSGNQETRHTVCCINSGSDDWTFRLTFDRVIRYPWSQINLWSYN